MGRAWGRPSGDGGVDPGSCREGLGVRPRHVGEWRGEGQILVWGPGVLRPCRGAGSVQIRRGAGMSPWGRRPSPTLCLCLSSRVVEIQSQMSERAVELLGLPEDRPCLLLDVG